MRKNEKNTEEKDGEVSRINETERERERKTEKMQKEKYQMIKWRKWTEGGKK